MCNLYRMLNTPMIYMSCNTNIEKSFLSKKLSTRYLSDFLNFFPVIINKMDIAIQISKDNSRLEKLLRNDCTALR